jgi:hypothetical protein
MDLRTIANQVSNTVNPNIIVSVRTSNGFTLGAAGRQTPLYNPAVVGPAQIQALDNSDLKKIEGMNLTGSLRALYPKGSLAGVIRPDSKGGDLVTIAAAPGVPALFVGVWLISKVLESWPLWTKVVIVKQSPAA